MGFTKWAVLAGAAWALTTVPAEGAWHSYISHPLGFSFEAPGDVKAGKGTYRAAVAGQRNTMTFQSEEDGIEYKVTVIDMKNIENNAATLLNEATYIFQDKKTLLMDTFGRVDREYGRKLTIDLPGEGRSTSAFYFIRGNLIQIQATALPGKGDVGSPELSRFIDSIAFFTVRARPDATELTLPK
jgi:hypothetical protein